MKQMPKQQNLIFKNVDLTFCLCFVFQAGHSPLHIVARSGHIEVARCLLLSGAEPGLPNKVCCQPIHTHTNPRGRVKCHQVDSPFCVSALVICEQRKVWSHMTPNVHSEIWCQ